MAVGLVFLAAALSKAAAPVRFQMILTQVLGQLGSESPVGMPGVVLLVTIEATLGVCYLFALYSRVLHVVTIAILCAVLAVLAAMWHSPPAGGCGCIGFWNVPDDPRREVSLGVMRNVGLILCILACWSDHPSAVTHAPAPIVHGRSRPPGAFTLLEMLCVIAVIAVVLALALPSLGRARQAGREAAEAVGARQVYLAMASYGADTRERFPFCASPGEIDGPLLVNGQTVAWQSVFFHGQARLYMNLLAPGYLASTRPYIVPLDPADPPSGVPPGVEISQVWLTYGAFASPRYWTDPVPPESPAMLGGAVWGDLATPSLKGLLLDTRAANRLGTAYITHAAAMPWGVVWGDGASTRHRVNLTIPYRTLQRPGATFDWPVLATEGGLAGRDFEPR